jgi:hypothetical protein
MLEEKAVFSPTIDHGMAYIGGGDGTMVLDHEFVVVSIVFLLLKKISSYWPGPIVEWRHELSD